MFDFLLLSKRALLMFGTSVTLASGTSFNATQTDIVHEHAFPATERVSFVETPRSSLMTDIGSAIVRLDLPVAWQLTRVRDSLSNPSMVTESFRETWKIEQRPTGEISLESPRARVLAVAMGGSEPSNRLLVHWPKLLMISEVDFARLVGVPESGEDTADDAADRRRRFVSLILRPARSITDVTLRLSDEQSVEIQIEIGSHRLF